MPFRLPELSSCQQLVDQCYRRCRSKEAAAIQFLASLEKRHQKLKNIENLYNFNAYLKSSLSTGDSSCNSSVVLVHE